MNRQKLVLGLSLLLSLMSLLNPLHSMAQSTSSDSLISSSFKLSEKWQSDLRTAEKILDNERIRGTLLSAWSHRESGDHFFIVQRELKGFYGVDYFIGREAVNEFKEFFQIPAANATDESFKLDSGDSVAKIDIKNQQDPNPPFRRGVWIWYPTSLAMKSRLYATHLTFFIVFRSDDFTSTTPTYSEFINWVKGLRLNQESVKVVSPDFVDEMRDYMTFLKIAPDETAIPKPEVKQARQPAPKPSMNLTDTGMAGLYARIVAPVVSIPIKKYLKKPVQALLKYDLESNSVSLVQNGKAEMVVQWPQVKNIRVIRHRELFRSGNSLLLLSASKGKASSHVMVLSLNGTSGYLAARDFVDRIYQAQKYLSVNEQ